MKLTRSLAEKIVCSRCFSIKFPPNTDQGPLDSINQIRHDDTRRQMLSCWRTCMSYRNAVDVLTIAARAASLRGVSLAEIEEILERDYRTAQRIISALALLFPELEKLKDEDSGKARWKLPHKEIAPLLTPTADELAALALVEEMFVLFRCCLRSHDVVSR